jgi:hypothetical protein
MRNAFTAIVPERTAGVFDFLPFRIRFWLVVQWRIAKSGGDRVNDGFEQTDQSGELRIG